MAKVTNNTRAPQGVRFNGVLRWVKPGASAEGEMTETEIAVAKRASLKVDGSASAKAASPEPPALTGKNKAELLEIAKAEGVTIEDGATNPDIVSAIELHREG